MDLILTITLCLHAIYISAMSILGLTDERYSALYSTAVMLFTVISIAYIIFCEASNKKKRNGSIIPYFIPIIFVFLYIVNKATNTHSNQSASFTQFLSSMSYTTSAIYIATYCYRYSKLGSILKNMNIVMIVITIAIALTIPKILSVGIISFGLGTYQTLSYLAAFAFGINLYNILASGNNQKFKFQKHKAYKIIEIFFLIIQIIGVFISGGRGGAVLLLANTLVLFYILSRHNLKRLIAFIIIFVPILYVTLISISPELANMIETRTERTFSYISEDGLDLSKTSGRDIVYSAALGMFAEKPLFGYGFYEQFDILMKRFNAPYVHNLIIEIVLQGGIVLLLIFTYLFIKHFNKLKTYLKIHKEHTLFVTIYLYAIIFLMFSGTYLGTTYFGFAMTYILMYNTSNKTIKRI